MTSALVSRHEVDRWRGVVRASEVGRGGESAPEWDEVRIDFAKYTERHKMLLSPAHPETILGLIGRSMRANRTAMVDDRHVCLS
jgi:hypothetical protein